MNELESEANRTYFLQLLDRLLLHPPDPVQLGSTHVCAGRPGDPPVKIHPYARLKIILAGSQKHALSRMGARQEFTLKKGQAVFWAANAWTLPHYDRHFVFFGLVFQPGYLRLILESPPRCTRSRNFSSRYYHTATPLSAVGTCLVAALSELTRKPPDPTLTGLVFRALLRAAREHLAADTPAANTTQGFRTWRRVMDYLQDNYSAELTRESAARVLDLHPNYISYLFRSFGGQTFHEALENLRLERARHLLRHCDFKVTRVGQMCGYAGTSYFIKAFKRKYGVTPNSYRMATE